MVEREGFDKPLANPVDANVDIVFIHGLGGGRVSTWTHKPSGVYWPKSLLPDKIPTARILSYGYNSKFLTFFPAQGPVNQSSLNGHASNFLSELSNLRSGTDSESRPLFFVAHSLGGLLLAHSLQRQDGGDEHVQKVVQNTRGIVFLGTPFGGSKLASWADIANNFMSKFCDVNEGAIKNLKKHSEMLDTIAREFPKFLISRLKSKDMHDIEIVCFFEQYSMKKNSGIPGLKISGGRVVEEASASIIGYDSIGLAEDHRSMCKYEDEEKIGFVKITEKLIQWIGDLNDAKSSNRIQATIVQGNVTNRIEGSNSGVMAGNCYTPASNGIRLIGKSGGIVNNYHHSKASRRDKFEQDIDEVED